MPIFNVAWREITSGLSGVSLEISSVARSCTARPQSDDACTAVAAGAADFREDDDDFGAAACRVSGANETDFAPDDDITLNGDGGASCQSPA